MLTPTCCGGSQQATANRRASTPPVLPAVAAPAAAGAESSCPILSWTAAGCAPAGLHLAARHTTGSTVLLTPTVVMVEPRFAGAKVACRPAKRLVEVQQLQA